jgi:hypothetical protein
LLNWDGTTSPADTYSSSNASLLPSMTTSLATAAMLLLSMVLLLTLL